MDLVLAAAERQLCTMDLVLAAAERQLCTMDLVLAAAVDREEQQFVV